MEIGHLNGMVVIEVGSRIGNCKAATPKVNKIAEQAAEIQGPRVHNFLVER